MELADKLSARGFRSDALNGDIPQANREKIIDRLRGGKLDILIATDVVARGLDVERISHVINYDVPHDTESYIHRIGRTGRAGRSGQAILFVAPREKRMLYAIERATNQPITAMDLPSVADINRSRVDRFKQSIVAAVANQNLDLFSQIIAELQHDDELSAEQIAAAAAFLAQGDTALLLDEKELKAERAHGPAKPRDADFDDVRLPRSSAKPVPAAEATPLIDFPEVEMRRFRIEVGRRNQVKPGNIVGAIANEAELESKYIGEIEIREDYSTVDLPADMPKEIMAILKRARVAGRPMEIAYYSPDEVTSSETPSSRSKATKAVPAKKRYESKKGKNDGGKKRKPASDYAKRKRSERKR